MSTSFPIFPANAGTQMQPMRSNNLAPNSLMIWAPAFAGEFGFRGYFNRPEASAIPHTPSARKITAAPIRTYFSGTTLVAASPR